MKISNSKKELARIISENGGWRDVSEFAAQDGDGTGSIDFFESKPRYDKDSKCWNGEYDYRNRIKHADVTIKNFHQTILSREEYFHLYPAPDADGWIEWEGGKCPVDKGVLVDVKFRDGTVQICCEAMLDKSPDHKYWTYVWSNSGGMYDIIAYRLHKPEQAQPQSPVEMAFDIIQQGVKPESKPTIEQLAADYRNSKDYAYRKQVEADAAKDDADAKLADLVAAGKALNLVIGVSEKEPEQVITDWRDLQLGDIIEYVDGSIIDKIGMTGPVVEFAPDAAYGMHVRLKCDNGPNKGRLGWPTKWKFIRRP